MMPQGLFFKMMEELFILIVTVNSGEYSVPVVKKGLSLP